MADLLAIIRNRHPDIEITRHEGKHLRAQCPRCAEAGGDTSKDNLVITPDKGIAKCFACGYVIGTNENLERRYRCIHLLHQNEAAKEYLRSRKVLEAALDSEMVGWTDEKMAEEIGFEGLVFFCKQGYNVRSIIEKKFKRASGVKASPFEIHTGAADWMVCEGEIDALTLYSIFGNNFNYAAMGGAGNFEKIKYPEPFYVVPDNDSAGQEALKKLEHKNYFLLEVPFGKKDVNEAILEQPTFAKDALLEQALKPKLHLKPANKIITEVEEILMTKQTASRLRNKAASEVVLKELMLRGEFINHYGQIYYWDKTASKLVAVSQKSAQWISIVTNFGLYSSEQVNSIFHDILLAEMLYKNKASQRPIHITSHYDWDKHALYIDLGGARALEITSDKQRIIPYGDVLFFSPPGRNIEFIDPGDDDYLWEALGAYTIQEENHKKMLYAWVLATLFASMFETKPILIIESVAGSGKTSLAKLLGRILVGPQFDVTSLSDSIDSFMAVISRNPIVVFDNAEKINKEMLDHIAMAATGATFQKRKLYHEFDTVSAPARAWIIFTMMHNSLKRKDIVERSIIIKMERITDFKPAKSLYDKVNFQLIWGSIIKTAQKIVALLKEQGFVSRKETVRKIRMADFAVFMDLVCQVKGWDTEELAQWWLKNTAVEALQDNLYNIVFLQAIDNLKAWGRKLTAKEVIEEMKSIPLKDRDAGGIEVSRRDKERLQSIRPKGFWAWLDSQKENFEQLGYRLQIFQHGTWRHKSFSIIKTEDAVEPLDFTLGEVEDVNITEAPY